MPTPTSHSRKYSPSKSSTWLNCPLSTLLNDGSSQETNPQAEFGTQCHELGAALISKSLSLVDYDSEIRTVEDVIKGLDMYSEEMQGIADGYADFVIQAIEFERKRSDDEPLIVIEQHLDMDFDEDAGGTLDCGIISSVDGGTLTVIDLKTGRTPVYTFDSESGQFNSQLGIYALYFYKSYKDIYPVNKVRLVIYQPVISNTNDYEMPIEELLQFEARVLIPAVERTKVDNPEAKVGKYCRYCAGKAICAKRAETNLELTKEIKKSVATLTDAQIEAFLPQLDELIQFAEDVKEFALKKAMNGHKWSNFKLVQSKGSRKIVDEDAVVKVCEATGIDPYAPRKVAGITELTKRIGKDKLNDLIGPYIAMQAGSIVLVPKTDTREEVIIIEEGDKN
jgi:CRISPR/Cas system-associated exonuclease Cas4 (RecB family)